MNYRRPLVLDVLSWLHATLMFAAVYPFLSGFLDFSGEDFRRTASAGILILLPVVASFLLQQKINALIPFFLCGAAFSAGCVYLSYCWGGIRKDAGMVCGTAMGICCAIIFGFRIYTKVLYGKSRHEFYAVHAADTPFELKERELSSPLNSPKLYHLIWISALYVLEMLLHDKASLYVLYGIFLVDVFVSLGYQYISALYEFVRTNRRLASLPLASMHRIHRLLGIIGALLLALFLLPSLLYGHEFEPQLRAEKPTLTFDEVMQPVNTEFSAPEISDTQIAEVLENQKPTPQWVLTLIRVMGWIVSAVMVITAIVLIIRGVRNLGKEFAVSEEDEIVFLKRGNPDTGETASTAVKKEGYFSRRQQIRRRYRKTIQKGTKGRPSAWATPSELEQNAALSGSPEMNELHDSYEKARYSKF